MLSCSGSSNSRGVFTETEILSSNGRFGVITSMNMNVSFGEFKTGTYEFLQTKKFRSHEELSANLSEGFSDAINDAPASIRRMLCMAR